MLFPTVQFKGWIEIKFVWCCIKSHKNNEYPALSSFKTCISHAGQKGKIRLKSWKCVFVCFFYSKVHDSLGSYTRLLSSQTIISTNSMYNHEFERFLLPHPIHFGHVGVKCHFWTMGTPWIQGFYHSSPFLMKNFLIAEFRILSQERLTISHQ